MKWRELAVKLKQILPFRFAGDPLAVIQPANNPEGYLCITRDNEELLGQAEPGKVVENQTSNPPWIVVDQRPENIIWGSDWPIDLWRVKILKKIEPQGHWGSYTRCTSIEFLEHLPTYRIFGKTDSGLIDLLDYAQGISIAHVNLLAKYRNPMAAEVYSNGWNRWLKIHDNSGSDDDNAGTLLVSEVSHGSPVGHALVQIDHLVYKQAKKLEPESAFEYDQHEGEEYLIDPWQKASSALCDAALVLGSPSLFKTDEIELLIEPLLQASPDFAELLAKN